MKNTMKKAMAAVMVMAAMLLAVPGTDAQAATMRISRTSMTLKIGKSKTLKMKNATGKVKWKTSRKSVATVTKKGKVTARKAGKAFIQAKVSGRTYECRVTVKGAAKKNGTGNAADTDATNTAGTENTDVTNTDTNKNPADTDTSATGTQATENTQPEETKTEPVHEHDWVPHYSYNANGKPRKDAMFCSDVTCPYNNGYGTDNGWRGESLTGNTDTGTTEPSQGTAVQQPTTPVTDNSNTNTQDTVTNEPSVTEPAVTENPVQEGQPKEHHHHAWTIPVLSDDKLTVVGYACACGEASHVHSWDIVHRVEDGFSAGAVDGWECSKCGETINTADYEELTKANNAASEAIKQAWVAKNITAGMTELEKVKAILNELHFWHYGSVPGLPTNISRTTMCGGANKAFVEYCAAVGIRAEQVDASKELNVPDHYIAYVWVDGEQYVADATPESHGLMGTQDIVWTMDGLDLYLDCLNGIVTEEEFDQYMPGYEK